ncbi:hypothetical protein GALMADRAFT_145697 [Galerina marginata CBS 339.88]|uniref:Nephrocystin 3-like N-terminal domain-containing protein n=1 Tax=Galerina marginata (strain CBS 339.88) TaxID=685588 RepID=A0A067SEG0_GALM3|nr:hypothetical protein GALMADRAFT_145697 [Galerina marginata CBS 339.88]
MSNHSTLPFPAEQIQSQTGNEVIGQILSWMDDPNATHDILWLHGPDRSGKSTLAQSITEICRASHRLGGSFFFHRGVKGCDEGAYLFSTLAYQLAQNHPELLESIDNAISRNRLLPTKPVEVQFHSLIVEPIQNSVPPSQTSVIIIDGLDECQGTGTQQLILRLISEAVLVLKLPLRFIITSRRDPDILKVFNSDRFIHISRSIALDNLFYSTHVEGSLHHSLVSHHSDEPQFFMNPRWRRPKRKPPFQTSSYPRIVTLQQSNGGAETYSRALLLQSHGFPVWHPSGDIGKPVEYLQKGVTIGDVGVLDKDGIFDFYFNIFLTPDDPVHARSAPREFQPIKPPLQQAEITLDQEYFKPGDVVSSRGIKLTRHSESPLDISFTSTEQEGAILILPDGASREDLISTARFHEYAKRNAPHWYQVVNGYGGVVHTNGSLFLVTGCDKARNWAAASFPYHANNSETSVDLRYTWQPDYEPPWDSGTAVTKFYAPPSFKKVPNSGTAKNQCVFVRGMRISLSEPSWSKTLPQLWSARLYYSYILHTPSKLQLWVDSTLVFLRLRLSERRAVKKVTSARLQLFHPNFVIGQVLLAEYPDSEVALVDDSVWCSLTHGESCTLLEMNELVTQVFAWNKIVQKDGVVTLVPKKQDELETVTHDGPNSLEEFARKLLSIVPHSQAKPQPTRLVEDVPVTKHAKMF